MFLSPHYIITPHGDQSDKRDRKEYQANYIPRLAVVVFRICAEGEEACESDEDQRNADVVIEEMLVFSDEFWKRVHVLFSFQFRVDDV